MVARRADVLGRDLRHRLAPDRDPARRRCGVEHEYVVTRAGKAVDFGALVGRLVLPGRRLDPVDPNARRQPWGGAFTVDGREAEVVTPPLPLRPDATRQVAALAGYGRRRLHDALTAHDPSFELAGYSTHLNVEVPDRASVRVAQRVLRCCSSDLMLLIDRRTSPGLLIRPRRGRLEIGGEYLVNDQLRGAITFTAGAVAALGELGVGARPPRLEVRGVPADTRYGWYVDRRAFGVDLYAHGRDALLPSRRGTIRAGDHLAASWAAFRDHAAAFSTPAELATVDDLVAGRASLPLERPDLAPMPSSEPGAHAAGAVVLDVRRAGFRLTTRATTWDATLFRLVDERARTAVVCIPDADLAAFLDRLRGGDLDELLRNALAHPSGRILASAEQTTTAGIWDDVADPSLIAPPERDLQTGRVGGGGGTRPDKGQASSGRPGRSTPRWLVPVAVGVAVVLLAGAVALAVSGGSGGSGGSKPVAAGAAGAAARAPVVDDQLSGTYQARITNVRTTQSSGTLSGLTATLSGQTVSYPPPDGAPQQLTFPAGPVTLDCVDGTCTTTGPSGVASVVIQGATIHGTSQGQNNVIARCGATAPAGAAGSGGDTPMQVTRATVKGRTRVTVIRYRGVYGFAKTVDNAPAGGCVGYLVGDFDVVLTR